MKVETQKHLLAQIQENFKTFGAGQQFPGANMTALALEDGPLVFAAGVDVADVVALVLRESGHQELVDTIQNALVTVAIVRMPVMLPDPATDADLLDTMAESFKTALHQ